MSATYPPNGLLNWDDELRAYIDSLGTGASLDAASSVGATSITLNTTAPRTARYLVAIDAFTAECEIRSVTVVAGAVLTVSALEFAHAKGDKVLFIDAASIHPGLFGCLGNASTNDHTGLQNAVRQATNVGVWLDGQGRTYAISQPLMLPQSHKVRLSVRALGSFAPAETNNAMIMGYNGNVRAFTADPSTDVLTATAHGIPGDNIGLVFQGSNLPGGLTAGKFYYARDRTTDTFKVSATSGGAAVDITSAGSGGTVFCEVYAANMKSSIEDSFFDGQNVTGLNGMLMSVQQNGYWDKVRVDNFPGYGVKFKGQQHVMYNFESITCNKAVVLDDMAFLYCYGFNAEKCDRAIYVDTGGASSCHFYGIHLEMNVSGHTTAASIGIDIDNAAHNMIFDGVNVTMNTSGQTFFQCATGSSASSSYVLRSILWTGGISSAGQSMVVDTDRSVTLDQWDDCKGILSELVAPRMPSSQAFPDPVQTSIIGNGGRRIYMGSQNNDQALMRLRGGSAQTGRLTRWDNTSGTEMLGVNVAGELILQSGPRIMTGTGTPEGAVTAPVGSIFTRSDGGANTTLYRKESGAGNTGWQPVANSGASPIMHVCVLPGSTISNAFIWTNMPAAETILFGTNVNRFGLDLTNMTQMRWSFWLNVVGATGSKLFVQYSTTENGTYAAIDGSTGTELVIDSGGTARKRSSWVNLVAGAKADVYVRVAGSGGDAAADPGFGSMFLEFR